MEPNTAQTQLTPTTTTGQLAATTAPTLDWNIDTFGLGTSVGTEGKKEDDYDTDAYFKTYDDKWYSKDEINEAIWEKFKDVYNWKHMRGSTAHAIENDVLDIIRGLYNGDLTLYGGLLYTVKNSKNSDLYSSWKSKYEGNKPHHANSKYDSNAKNNAAWVVMLAFGTLTDERSKKKSLQESTSTNKLSTLKKDIYDDMIWSLGVSNETDYNSFYSKDALDNSTLSRSTDNRILTIQNMLDTLLKEYANKDLQKEYGIADKIRKRLGHTLMQAYKSILDGTLAQGDYSSLSALNQILGINLDWDKLLRTDFSSDEWKAIQAELKAQDEEKKKKEAFDNFINSLYPENDSDKDIGTLNIINDNDINQKYPNLLNNINQLGEEKVKKLLKAAITSDSTNPEYKNLLQSIDNNKDIALLIILQAAKNKNILKSTNNPNNSNQYYVPFLSPKNHIYVVDFSNNKINRKWVKFTDIPALKDFIKDTYDKGIDKVQWWNKFKEAASLTL